MSYSLVFLVFLLSILFQPQNSNVQSRWITRDYVAIGWDYPVHTEVQVFKEHPLYGTVYLGVTETNVFHNAVRGDSILQSREGDHYVIQWLEEDNGTMYQRQSRTVHVLGTKPPYQILLLPVFNKNK